MKHLLVTLFCLLAFPAFAMEGGKCSASVYQLVTGQTEATVGAPVCRILCEAVTNATIHNCPTTGPIWAPVQDAWQTKIIIVTANNGGAVCAYDDWAVVGMASTTASPAITSYFPSVVGVLDDDGSSATYPTVPAGASPMIINGSLGPYAWIKSGALPACSDFTVYGFWYPAKR